MPRKPQTDEQKDAKRAQIIAAAMELIEEGTDPTMRAIGKRTGMAAMTAYTYVEGHEEIIDALAGYALDPEGQSAAYLDWFFDNIPVGHPVAQQIIKDGKAIR